MNSYGKPACYVASPYGFAESTKPFYYDVLLPMLKRYLEVIDPWVVDVSHVLAAPKSEQPKLWAEVGQHHFKTIKTKAKILIACLDQEPPDTGTVAELSYAFANNIPVIGYRNDLRTNGEESLPYNLMVVAAIEESGGVAVNSLAELEKELQNPSTDALKAILQI